MATHPAEETRTVLQPNRTSVWWTPGDEICIFYGTEPSGSRFVAQNTEPAAKASFSGTISAFTGMTEDGDFNYFWAVYPYSAAVSYDGTSVQATLTHEQTAIEGTFATNTLVTLAKSSGLSLSFYHVCAGIRFQVTKPGVKTVTLRGNNNEDIAGSFRVTMSEGDAPRPTLPVITSGQKEISLSAAPGESLKVGADYYLVLLPQTFSNGLTLTFNTETETGSRSYGAMSFTRGEFKRSTNADENVTYVPIATSMPVAAGGGTIVLPDTSDPVILDFSAVTDASDYLLVYSEGGAKPSAVYCTGKSTTSVGTLSGDLPESTVNLLSGAYAETSLTTALHTLIISMGVEVGKVTLQGGGLQVDGTVTSLFISNDAADSDLAADEIVVIINNTVLTVDCQETNCTLWVSDGGQVTSLETQAGLTTISGEVGSITASGTGSVTIEDGATVGSVEASGTGTVTVEGNATVDSVSSSGEVTVDISSQAKTSGGGTIPHLSVKIGDGQLPLSSGIHDNLSVVVLSNCSWSCTLPDASTWVCIAGGALSASGNGDGSFAINVSSNPNTLGRQASFSFVFDRNTSSVILAQAGAGSGFEGSIDDWGDGGEGGFTRQ